MNFTKEVEQMVCVAKGPKHGPAPIPQEGAWTKAKEITDISGLTHGVGWCAPQQGACKLTLNVKLSKEYLTEMVKTARMFPTVRFWTYTKFHSVVNEYVKENGGKEKAIPANLSIMFSEWTGMEMDNPYGFGTFIVVDKEQTPPAGVWHCTGDCGICIRANRGCVVNETAWVWKH